MNNRFQVLDGFRGVAALMVVVFHFKTAGYISSINLIENSWLFVEFFFVLSGFVVGYVYLDRIDRLSYFKIFMWRRFSRLWPLHFFMTLMFVPFALANTVILVDLDDRFSLHSFWTNMALLQAFGLNDFDTWNMPAWSISVEFYTYAIFGLMCVFSLSKYTVLKSLVISMAACIILYYFSSMGDTNRFAFFRCIYSFFLGVVAFKLHVLFKVRGWMEIFAIFIVVFLMSINVIEPTDVLAYVMPFVFLFMIVVFSKESGVVSKFLSGKIMLRMGALSFSIYMTHTWIIGLIKAISVLLKSVFDYQFVYIISDVRVVDFGVYLVNDLIYIPYVALVFLLSSLTYKYVEMPWQKRLNGYFNIK